MHLSKSNTSRYLFHLNKNSQTDAARSSFMYDLMAFYNSTKTFKFIPKLAGRDINLHQLFLSVTNFGGYKRVCEHSYWDKVASSVGLATDCFNIAIALRSFYFKFLGAFELDRYPFLSEGTLDKKAPDCIEDTLLKAKYISPTFFEFSCGIALSNFHETFNNGQTMRSEISSLQEKKFSSFQLPITLVETLVVRMHNELEMLENGILSGLANEVDLALNALLILSNFNGSIKINAPLDLTHLPNLLRLLLASVGIHDDDPCSLIPKKKKIFLQNQFSLNFEMFWESIISSINGRNFLDRNVFAHDMEIFSNSAISPFEYLFRPLNKTYSSIISGALEETLEQSRILIIATIFVNLITFPQLSQKIQSTIISHGSCEEDDLSYENAWVSSISTGRRSRIIKPIAQNRMSVPPVSVFRKNARILASSSSALRFAFLCGHAEHSGIKKLGMQILSTLKFLLCPPRALSTDHELHEASLFNEIDTFWKIPWVTLAQPEQDDYEKTVRLNCCMLSKLTLTYITRCLMISNDRQAIITGLNMLANMSFVAKSSNTLALSEGLPCYVWARIFHILCLPDVGLVCAALEALLGLSSLGPIVCQRIWDSSISREYIGGNCSAVLISVLLALLNIEGQTLGGCSLNGIKLLQRIPTPKSNSSFLSMDIQNILQQHHNIMPKPLNLYAKSNNSVQNSFAHNFNKHSLVHLLASSADTDTKVHPLDINNALNDRLQMPPPLLPPPKRLYKHSAPLRGSQPHTSLINGVAMKRDFEITDSNYLYSEAPSKISKITHEEPYRTDSIEAERGQIVNNYIHHKQNLRSIRESVLSNDCFDEFSVSSKYDNRIELNKTLEKRSFNDFKHKSNSHDCGSCLDNCITLVDNNNLNDFVSPMQISNDYGNEIDSYGESEIDEYAAMIEKLRYSSSSSVKNFLCEWGGNCKSSFNEITEIVAHVYSRHLKKIGDIRSSCNWLDCSTGTLPRAKFALISHVLDAHCNEVELNLRKQSRSGINEKISNKSYEGHPNDASGWTILRNIELGRLQNENWLPHLTPIQYGRFLGKDYPVTPPILPPREGPVTKHLRVTAALILHNLVVNLQEAKYWVHKERPFLCEIAFGISPSISATSSRGGCLLKTNDASSIIAKCLFLAESL